MAKNRFTRSLAIFYGALFLIYGTHLPYFPVWLRARGLDVQLISMIVAAPLFLRFALNPIIAAAADRTKSHVRYVRILAALALMAALILTQTKEVWSLTAYSIGLAMAFTATMPLIETIAVSGVREMNVDYGRMRLWGSASFIAASFLGGVFIERLHEGIIIWLLVAAGVLTLAASMLLPKGPPALNARPPTKPDRHLHPQNLDIPVQWSPGREQASPNTKQIQHLRSRLFILFLVCGGLSQASHATYYTFGTLHWLDQGISPQWVGFLWALGVGAEIVLFTLSQKIISRTGPVVLMIIGAFGGLTRWLAMASDPPLAALIPLQVLHALTYGASHIGAIHFIARNIPHERTGTAQALYGGVGNGSAMALAILVSGWIYASYGALTYLAMAALSFVATLAGFMILRTCQSKPRNHDNI